MQVASSVGSVKWLFTERFFLVRFTLICTLATYILFRISGPIVGYSNTNLFYTVNTRFIIPVQLAFSDVTNVIINYPFPP